MEISIPIYQHVQGGWGRSSVQFVERGHEQYYYGCQMSNKVKHKKIKNKQKKCVDVLSKNQKLDLLKSFSESFKVASDTHNPYGSIVYETDGVAEAAEVFLKKLEEMKQQGRKEMKMQKRMKDESSSSSSSSSESDSDCCSPTTSSTMAEAKTPTMTLPATTSATTVSVCMGGKCKKAGGEALVEELKRQTVATQTQITTCKCMGKCKSAPNVKLHNTTTATATTTTNPLFIGLALDNLPSILHSIFPTPPPLLSP